MDGTAVITTIATILPGHMYWNCHTVWCGTAAAAARQLGCRRRRRRL